ncbi:hypothetical protein ACFY8C_38585 [Streptomyces flavochromogenes]|uniref:Uncharacterized protein n=1 Tax=Streptomyces flavochromogenes TaxID=68199 RepID=A0ABW6Y367_9ACTN
MNSRDDALDRWIGDYLHAMDAALDEVLDVEAGLHDALLHSRAAAADEALDEVLDVEAGLHDALLHSRAAAADEALDAREDARPDPPARQRRRGYRRPDPRPFGADRPKTRESVGDSVQRLRQNGEK